MEIYSINAETFKLDGGAMFGVVPKTIWQKKYPADENNLCVWAMRCLLIKQDDKIILIDTSLGDKQDEKFFSFYYVDRTNNLISALQKHGVTPEMVTDVLLTHLHFDHVGGAVIKKDGVYKPLFTNAKYWTNKTHWHLAMNPNPREKASFLKENLLPLQEHNQLHFIEEKQNIEWTKNISIKFSYGHTSAMMMPVIKYKNKTIIYIADTLPSAGHIPIAYVTGYDTNPLITMQEKEMLLTEIVNNDYVVFLEHDPYYECCTIEKTDKGFKLKNTFDLQSIV